MIKKICDICGEEIPLDDSSNFHTVVVNVRMKTLDGKELLLCDAPELTCKFDTTKIHWCNKCFAKSEMTVRSL